MQNQSKIISHIRYIGLAVGFTLFVLFALYSGQNVNDPIAIKGKPSIELSIRSATKAVLPDAADTQVSALTVSQNTAPTHTEAKPNDAHASDVATTTSDKSGASSVEADIPKQSAPKQTKHDDTLSNFHIGTDWLLH